ncbi:DUF58 domain-containing protein [Kineosporia succinea]|uniref:Uncharacterized protein (DUF58 family) n=1 Tax=Kineosporia succinea TaxID=84632 RepID=A0ABT9NYL6_9ACTN|nr:DUF58 domain-containing protein [Kineosporia succinea]MDP9825391.1 uncharacterized protein (DUF58 family) [Kineosporia succinea]
MTISGRAVVLAALGLVPAVIWPGWGSVLAWAGVFVAVVLADLLLAGSPRALKVHREPVPTIRLGTSTPSPFVVSNHGRRTVRGSLRDAWQPSAGAVGERHPVKLPAGQSRRLVTTLTPTRRGDRRAGDLTVRSFGPLGVAARQYSLTAPGALRVLPPFTSRKHLPSKLAQLRELDGKAALRVRGQGTEFDSLREYVGGDDVRSIDWRATARRGAVVVRTWRPERDRRVLIVLDTSRTSAARVGDQPRLDAAMDSALLLAALASRAGDRVDLLAMDRRVRARVEGAGRGDLLPRLVTAMAPVEADLVEADWAAIVSTVLSRMSQRALVVLLTPLEGAAIEEGLMPVIGRLCARHRVVVASVADPQVAAMAEGRGDAYAVYGAAAAGRAALDRAATTAELRRMGVDVVDASPEDLPPQLADRYLALKAAGLL